ncbi:MAG: outer membrane protein assembly factor BamB family protein [Planctomycetota bacterium]|jgi:outer membrane protein assembly factor BamB
MIRMPMSAVVALSICTLSAMAPADDWSHWRGPDGTGVAPGSSPPASLDASSLRWKVAIPGDGHASPIIMGDRIYVMTAIETDRVDEAAQQAADEAEKAAEQAGGGEGRGRGRGGRGGGFGITKPVNIYEFRVMALDRADGSVVWNTLVKAERPHEGKHSTGSFAGGSPVTDGTHLYTFFGSRGIYCLDMDGNVQWGKDLGDQQTRRSFGEGATPAVQGNTLVVPWDHEGDSFVAALDKRTGAELWRRDRDEPTAWTTPVIVEVNGRQQAILGGTNASIGYDIETGDEIWRCGGMTTNMIPTPIVRDGVAYLMSGFRGAALQAIKLADARGDITGTPVVTWSVDRGTSYVPSALLSGDRLYFLRGNNAILSCHSATTGEALFSGERLEMGNVYASPVGGGGKLYICDREGMIAVIEDGPTLKVLATNELGEGIDATPAIVGDAIYVRGSDHLFCFGAK